MKVGDYVRTKLGIAKIIDIKKNPKGEKTIFCLDKEIIDISDCELGDMYSIMNPLAEELTDKFDTNFGDEKQIIKSSPNIIDLIEVGDYVDRLRVVDKKEDYIVVETFDERIVITKEDNIKSIVTKKQFESMGYKIND